MGPLLVPTIVGVSVIYSAKWLCCFFRLLNIIIVRAWYVSVSRAHVLMALAPITLAKYSRVFDD